MIQPLVMLVLILPLLIGILSVDIHGNQFSIREWLNLNNATSPATEGYIESQIDITGDVSGESEKNAFLEFPEESQEAIDTLTKQITTGISFLLQQSKILGVWIGVTTAPFHYVLAVLIAFLFIFPEMWIFVVGFFYILIKEHKEIRQEIHDARVRAKMK